MCKYLCIFLKISSQPCKELSAVKLLTDFRSLSYRTADALALTDFRSVSFRTADALATNWWYCPWHQLTWSQGIQHSFHHIYRKISNIRRTLVGNKIVDHSDVVGASPANYIFILDLTSGFKGFGKDSHKAVWESFKWWDSVRLILETWR